MSFGKVASVVKEVSWGLIGGAVSFFESDPDTEQDSRIQVPDVPARGDGICDRDDPPAATAPVHRDTPDREQLKSPDLSLWGLGLRPAVGAELGGVSRCECRCVPVQEPDVVVLGPGRVGEPVEAAAGVPG